jgi:TPP-dependent pyruvate/acetoin dehydrogenase alpha subunit
MMRMQEISVSNKANCLKTLEVMLLTRFVDEKMSKLIRQNKGGAFHLSTAGHAKIGDCLIIEIARLPWVLAVAPQI